MSDVEREPVEGIWTNKERGLAFCWPCLDKMGGLAEGIEECAEGIKAGEWVECESCGVPLMNDGYCEGR